MGRGTTGFDNGGVTATLPDSLTLGSVHVDTPVVLAPMAGITNAAYRRLCAEQGAGLYVCEMITSRGLVEGDETTQKMLVFDDLANIRDVIGELTANVDQRTRHDELWDREPVDRIDLIAHRSIEAECSLITLTEMNGTRTAESDRGWNSQPERSDDEVVARCVVFVEPGDVNPFGRAAAPPGHGATFRNDPDLVAAIDECVGLRQNHTHSA